MNGVSPKSNLYEKAIGDTLVLAPADGFGLPDINHAFCLEGVAVDIWHLLLAGKDEDDIVHELVEEYDVEAADLRRDVHDFLDELAKKGLVGDEC